MLTIKITVKDGENFIDPPIFDSRADAIEWLRGADYLDNLGQDEAKN